jgi:asparagine N-glycosylation enzyme membrane subunit Stt3
MLRKVKATSISYLKWARVGLFAVLFKGLFTGFEFITTFIVMLGVPIFHARITNKLRTDETVRIASALIIGIVAGVALLIGILVTQIAISQNSVWAGVEHITQYFIRRTHAGAANYSGG